MTASRNKGSNGLIVHHVDEDRKNNDPSNLQAMHRGCHTELHRVWENVTEDGRERIRASVRGHLVSVETREKIAATKRGKPRDEATRKKISAALQGKYSDKQRLASDARKGVPTGRSSKISEGVRRSWQDPTRRVKQSAGLKLAWQDPDRRAKWIAAQKEGKTRASSD